MVEQIVEPPAEIPEQGSESATEAANGDFGGGLPVEDLAGSVVDREGDGLERNFTPNRAGPDFTWSQMYLYYLKIYDVVYRRPIRTSTPPTIRPAIVSFAKSGHRRP